MRIVRSTTPDRVRQALAAALVVGALVSLNACQVAEQSSAVDQQRIWADYELAYDGESDVTTARATFRFGNQFGTPLDLTAPSEVRFDGDLLSRRAEPGTGIVRYERTYSGLRAEGTFRFVDTEDELYRNDVSLREIEFPYDMEPLDNDYSYAIGWDGPALLSGEVVDLTLSRWAGGSSELGVFQQRQSGAREIILDRGQLSRVEPGEVTLRMTRTLAREPYDATDAGGRITVRWKAVPRRGTVVD